MANNSNKIIFLSIMVVLFFKILLLLGVMCMLTGCEKDAFERTNKGMQTLSCYIDGKPYAFEQGWFMAPGQRSRYFCGCRTSDKLLDWVYCFSLRAIPCRPINDSDGEIRSLTIHIVDTEPLVLGKKYFFNVHEEQSDFWFLECYAHFENYATNGWVEFRALEKDSNLDDIRGIVSGDFEFKESLEDGSIMHITQGTFDF